jgi:tRNA threonylcarbamoyladenosine biosynthesis protein TsaE
MRAWGTRLARHVKPGDVLLLTGPVGSGKTTFAQGVAAGLGIKQYLRSSSFILVNEYCARGIAVYHIDLYRLEGIAFDAFGLEEYMSGESVCIIEWADKIHLPSTRSCWNIDFQYREENTREIIVSHKGFTKPIK